MNYRFTILPLSALVAMQAAPAQAENFLSIQEAQQIIFPGATLTPADFRLDAAQVTQLRLASGTTIFRPTIKLWRVSTGGWFYLDQVLGRDDRITYAVGLDASGRIKAVEILVCLSGYDDIRRPAWLRTFRGRQYSRAHLGKEIPNISGTTLSAAHIADGVTRILATHALFVAPRNR